MKPNGKGSNILGSTEKRTVRILKAAMIKVTNCSTQRVNMANYAKGLAYLMKTEEDQLDLMILSAKRQAADKRMKHGAAPDDRSTT